MSKKKHRKSKSKGRGNGAVARPQRGRVKGPEPETPKSPPNLGRRVWLTVAALAAVQGVVWAAREFVLPSESRELKRPLSELPMQLGDFEGAEKETDPHVFQYLGTERSVSRIYTREADGASVSVHCAAWDAAEEWVPHPPDSCYTLGGWERIEGETVQFGEGPEERAAVREFEQGGRRIKVMFWYQLGEFTYLTVEQAREHRRAFWGEREWPPVVKVLLQTDATDGADERLLEMAGQVDAWTRQL